MLQGPRADQTPNDLSSSKCLQFQLNQKERNHPPGYLHARLVSLFLWPHLVACSVSVPQPGLDPNEESEPLDPGEVPWVSLTLGLGPFLSLIGLTASHPPSVRYLSLTEFYPLFLLRGDNSQLFRILAVSCFWASSKIGIPWTDEKVCLFTENLTY